MSSINLLINYIKTSQTPDAFEIIDSQALDLNQKINHNTALLESIRQNNLEVLEALIANGSNVNEPNHPALLLACNLNNAKVVKILLDAGSRIDFVEDKSQSALNIAIKNDNSHIIDLICNSCKSKKDIEMLQNQLDNQHNYFSSHQDFNGGFKFEDYTYEILQTMEKNWEKIELQRDLQNNLPQKNHKSSIKI